MKNKPFKEVNTWKRHNVDVVFVQEEKDNKKDIVGENFHELNSLKKLKMKILFDGESVCETKAGAFGIKEFSFKLLKRKGFLFKTVAKKVDVLNWDDEKEYEAFIKWVEHFRMSREIQEAVKIQLMNTYLNEIEEQEVARPKELKYINLW